MDKYILKIALWLVIIILVCFYCSNIFSWAEPAGYDYNVVAGKTYEAPIACKANRTPAHITDEVYFNVDKYSDVIVMERDYNFAKVSKEIDGEVVFGYIDAWYLSPEANNVKYDDEKLGIIENAEAYYTPSSTYEDKYQGTYSGLVKVIATCNGYSLIRIADYDLVINDLMWVKSEDVGTYNSLRIKIGYVADGAKMYSNDTFREKASETIRENILSSTVKIIDDFEDFCIVKNKNGDSVVINKTDFIPLSSPEMIK